jgi:RimJ/RimL family protein N-acetyltransferase
VFRPEYPVRTARLDLRPFRPDDLDDLLAFRGRDDVARYLLTGPLDREQTRDLLKRMVTEIELREEGQRLALAAVRRDTGTLIGDLVLMWRSAEHRMGEIGYSLHPDHQGQGFAVEAGEALVRLGIEGVGLHRVIGRCDARNRASARVLERLGMRREAHFVRNELVKGEWCDELVYAVLEDEWRDRERDPNQGNRPAAR